MCIGKTKSFIELQHTSAAWWGARSWPPSYALADWVEERPTIGSKITGSTFATFVETFGCTRDRDQERQTRCVYLISRLSKL